MNACVGEQVSTPRGVPRVPHDLAREVARAHPVIVELLGREVALAELHPERLGLMRPRHVVGARIELARTEV